MNEEKIRDLGLSLLLSFAYTQHTGSVLPRRGNPSLYVVVSCLNLAI